MVKIVATRCILRLKCTKFISAGAPTQTPLGELTALPKTSYSWFEGVLLLRERKGKGRGIKGKGERGARTPSTTNLWLRH